MKDAYFFSHDSHARHDPKIISMRAVYGAQGYGWYWMIIEILRDSDDYHIDTSVKYWKNSMALDLGVETKKLEEFLNDCINEFNLFEIEEEMLYSNSLIRRMEKLDEKREKARLAANKRWANEKTKLETKKEPAKSKKSNSSIVKNISVLKDDKHWELFKKQLSTSDEFKGLGDKATELQRSRCVDWLSSKGKLYKDYRAMFKNWLRKSQEFNPTKTTGGGMVL